VNEKSDNDGRSEQEVQRRQDAILQGAFSGAPTPLKRIPKKNRESRSTKAGSASGATARTVPPRI
jgi:hypothetical protein